MVIHCEWIVIQWAAFKPNGPVRALVLIVATGRSREVDGVIDTEGWLQVAGWIGYLGDLGAPMLAPKLPPCGQS